jgi:hypothetical protein
MTSEESIKFNGCNISDSNMYIKMYKCRKIFYEVLEHINPLNAELNPICHLLALLAHHILHVSRIRVNTDSYTWPMYTTLVHYINP